MRVSPYMSTITSHCMSAKAQFHAARRQRLSTPTREQSDNDLCLFAHYDPNGRVCDYVLRYLAELREAHFDIVFISTATLAETELKKLKPLTSHVILRKNIGLDFGSWVDAFKNHKPNPAQMLLLCNDSVYGPLWNIGDTIKLLTETRADFYGMVKSDENHPHLQSWFLLFTPWVHSSAAFREIMSTDCTALSKEEIIRRLEIGTTDRLEAAGFKSHALYDPHLLKSPPRYTVNPSHFLWRQLIHDHKIPFIKIELLKKNPMRLSGVSTWQQIVTQYNPALTSEISEHLASIKASPARSSLNSIIQELKIVYDYYLGSYGLYRLQALNAGLGYALQTVLHCGSQVWSRLKARPQKP